MSERIDTSNNPEIPLLSREKPCDRCSGGAYFSTHCGAYVCGNCGAHVGLARCYCGWAAGGGNGRQELIEMGETIEGDEW